MLISIPSPDKRGKAECDPGIEQIKTWMAGTSPAMTERIYRISGRKPGDLGQERKVAGLGPNAEAVVSSELVTMKSEVCGGSGQARIT